MVFNCIGAIVYLMFGTMSANYITKMFLVRNQFDCGPIKSRGGGGGYSTQTGVQCSAQAQNVDPTGSETSEKGGLKDLKRVFDKF